MTVIRLRERGIEGAGEDCTAKLQEVLTEAHHEWEQNGHREPVEIIFDGSEYVVDSASVEIGAQRYSNSQNPVLEIRSGVSLRGLSSSHVSKPVIKLHSEDPTQPFRLLGNPVTNSPDRAQEWPIWRDISITNLHFKSNVGPETAGAHEQRHAILLGADDVKVSHCVFENFSGDGVYVRFHFPRSHKSPSGESDFREAYRPVVNNCQFRMLGRIAINWEP